MKGLRIMKQNIPRMRTLPQAYKEIKEKDPDSALTLRALRKMVTNGEMPFTSVANKKLINLDLLLEKLGCYNEIAVHVYSNVTEV